MVAPVRHRRARPRRLQPRHLRLTRLAADRAHARRARAGDRQHGRCGRGLLPRPRRRRADAADRPRLRLPADHPGDGRRRGARPRSAQRRARHRRRRVAVVRARRRAGSCSRSASRSTCSRRACSARRAGKTLFRDVLPNVAGPIFVLATLDLANAILLLSGLSFLGLGAQPPKAEWGSMVADGTQYFQWWWIGTFPGLAIFTVVLAFNFLGDTPARRLRPAHGAARRGVAVSTLAVEGLRVRLPTPAGDVTVVDGVDYEVQPAEVFGIAGESGSGKTVSMLALLGLLPDGSTRRGDGAVRRRRPDRDPAAPPAEHLAGATSRWSSRTRYTSLHPMLSVGKQLTEHVRLHLGLDRRSADDRAVELLARRAHPRPARRAATLPAPVLGRDAAAHRDRDRPRLPAAAADRRRADDCARRHRAGRDPAPARPAPPRARARGRADHARPRRPLVDRRPRLDLLRGPRRRVRARARTSCSARATRTRARCSTRCRIRRRRRSRTSSRSRARRRRPGGSLRAARSTRAARTRIDECRDRRAAARARRRPARSPATSTRSPPMSALELHDVVVDYHGRGGRVRAVAGASLSVERGRIVGLVGESGCGKSTLARAAVGLVTTTSGTVTFEGRPVTLARRRARAGRARAAPARLPEPVLVAQPAAHDRQPARRRDALGAASATRACASCSSSSACRRTRSSRYPHEFSGGQRQRIAIARALAADPSVIVLDEPLASLDASAQAQLANLLKRLSRELDVGLLLISHDLGDRPPRRRRRLGDVPRPDGRDRRRRRRSGSARASVHRGADRGRAARRRRGRPARGAARRGARPGAPAVRLPLPPALPVRVRPLPGRGAAARCS